MDLPNKESTTQQFVDRNPSIAKENLNHQRDSLAGDHVVLARLKSQRSEMTSPSKLMIEDPEVSTADNKISAAFTLKNKAGEPYKGKVCLVASFREKAGSSTDGGGKLQSGGKTVEVVNRQHCLDYHVSHFVHKALQITAPREAGMLVDVKLVTTTSDDETFYHPLLAH